MQRLVLALIVLLACAVSASAQVVNPGHVEYTPSADHAMLTKYVIGYFLAGATDPVQEADLAIVAPEGGVVTQVINSTPLPYGTYTAKLKSVAGAVAGDWSLPSNEFIRAPVAPPTALTIKK